MTKNNNKLDSSKLGDFYWAYADILRGIGISASAYDQRILAFMSLKLLIDNDKLLFNFDYKNQFGMNDVLYKKYSGADTKQTFTNIINDIDQLGINLNYFVQEAKYNPDSNENIISYINHPKVFTFTAYIEELPLTYLEMVLDIYTYKANFSNYPKENYKDLYEVTISRMKSLAGDLSGQHFTQKSIIHLMCEIAIQQIKKNDFIAIYDPACGTGSMIMESAHYFYNHLKNNAKIEVYGQEYHGQTWLLAKIFLEITSLDGNRQGIPNIVAYGNTLTSPAFTNAITNKNSFDFIIANPPFGVDWKHDYTDVSNNMLSTNSNFYVIKENNKLILPKKSDGQFLFMLHIIKLMLEEKKEGKRALAAIITSTSLLSNGSQKSAEAKIRNQIFNLGIIKSIVEQPQSMFTNTDISSHIWFLDSNYNKSIKILKTDNEVEPLFSTSRQPKDKMKNLYTSFNINKIIEYLGRSEETEFVTKNIKSNDIFDINISNQIGKPNKVITTNLDTLEKNIKAILKNLKFNEI